MNFLNETTRNGSFDKYENLKINIKEKNRKNNIILEKDISSEDNDS